MKKFFYIILVLIFLIFVSSINIFLKINSDLNHIIGINIVLGIYFLIIIACKLAINKTFKKSNISNTKNYRKEIKTTFANAFVSSSIISIITACIIYGFLKNILGILNLKTGLINYCVFASKIWFISSPFIGLEITVFKYFFTIDYWQKPLQILIIKLIMFILISFLFYSTRKSNCFIYAKPLNDIIFLVYYSRICFDITLKNA